MNLTTPELGAWGGVTRTNDINPEYRTIFSDFLLCTDNATPGVQPPGPLDDNAFGADHGEIARTVSELSIILPDELSLEAYETTGPESAEDRVTDQRNKRKFSVSHGDDSASSTERDCDTPIPSYRTLGSALSSMRRPAPSTSGGDAGPSSSGLLTSPKAEKPKQLDDVNKRRTFEEALRRCPGGTTGERCPKTNALLLAYCDDDDAPSRAIATDLSDWVHGVNDRKYYKLHDTQQARCTAWAIKTFRSELSKKSVRRRARVASAATCRNLRCRRRDLAEPLSRAMAVTGGGGDAHAWWW